MNSFRRIYALLPARDRIKAMQVLIIASIGAGLETVGIGLVVPVLSLLTSDLAAPEGMAITLADFIGIENGHRLVQIATGALAVVYVLKNLFLAFQAWQQTAFSYGVQQNIAIRLYSLYLNQPYSFHLQRNSAMMIRNITAEVGLFTSSVNGHIQIATEILVASAIIAFLLWYSPSGALLLIMLFGLAGWVFLHIFRKRISQWGHVRQYHDGQRVKHLQQGLGGVKDVILLGCQKILVGNFQEHNQHSADALRKQAAVQQFPRLWLESVAVVGLAIVVAVCGGDSPEASKVMPTLGLFAVSAVRMAPSINRILAGIQAIRFGSASVEKIYTEFSTLNVELSPSSDASIFPNPVRSIELESLEYSYEGASQPALAGVSFHVAGGEVIGIIGPSGSGKSTLIDLILGLLAPSQGAVKVDGEDIVADLQRWQSRIGYVPQAIYLTDDTLCRNVAFGRDDENIDDAAVNAAIDAAQLRAFVDSLPDGLNTVVGERGVRLSGGQRQRIGVARSLYAKPSVLILDEATSALDSETETALMESVDALKGDKTIIIVAHRLSTLSGCDRIYRLDAGRVAAEGPPAVMLKENNAART